MTYVVLVSMGNDTISEGKESAMQESQDKSKHVETNKKVAKLKTVRDESKTKKNNCRISNYLLGVHREIGGKRTSRGTREVGKQTRRNDGKTKT